MANARTEAIANADAHLNNVGLMTYSELMKQLTIVIGTGSNTHQNREARAQIQAAIVVATPHIQG